MTYQPVKSLLCIVALGFSLGGAAGAQTSTPLTGMRWVDLEKAGTEAFSAARYGDAERYLKEAVIKSAAFGESDMRYAQSLGDLGKLLTVRARFDEAEPLLEEELHARQMALGKDNLNVVPSMASMIQFYLAHGTAQKAIPLSEDVLAIVVGKMEERQQGVVKLKKGQPLTGWAGLAAPSERDPLLDLAITCDALADSHKLHGNGELAERLYRAAYGIKSSVYGPEHLSLANSYDSLGSLYFDRNDYPQAEYYLNDALEITEGILPHSNPQVFTRLDKLGKCLIKEQKYDEAEKLYLRAQDFWKDTPSGSGTEARAKYTLGSLYVEEKKYADAAPVLQQALGMAESYYGADSIALVPFLQRYADALFFLGDKDGTNKLRVRASTIAGAGGVQ